MTSWRQYKCIAAAFFHFVVHSILCLFHILLTVTALFSFWKVFGSPPFSGCAVITFHLRCGMLCACTHQSIHKKTNLNKKLWMAKLTRHWAWSKLTELFSNLRATSQNLSLEQFCRSKYVQINPKLEQLRNICEPLVRKQKMKLQGAHKSPETRARLQLPHALPANSAQKGSLSLSLFLSCWC